MLRTGRRGAKAPTTSYQYRGRIKVCSGRFIASSILLHILDAKRKMEVIPAINWKSDPILRAISVLLNPKNRNVPINKLLRQAYFVIEAQLEKARAEVNQLGGKL